MRFTAIDTSAWEELKKSIEELALCMREHFGMKPELPDLLHNGDVCRILNISKRTLQHYRDTSVLPFIQIGHKCYYKREDVEALLRQVQPQITTTMEYETINKETPEMKELISGIKEVSKRIREIAQTHCPLFGGEIYLTGREVCEHLFVSPRTLQDYRDRGIIPYTQIAGKILYRLSDINRLLQENYRG